jgi:hypothetical protein
MNWQVVGQLLSTGIVLIAGPAVIVVLALQNGNL